MTGGSGTGALKTLVVDCWNGVDGGWDAKPFVVDCWGPDGDGGRLIGRWWVVVDEYGTAMARLERLATPSNVVWRFGGLAGSGRWWERAGVRMGRRWLV